MEGKIRKDLKRWLKRKVKITLGLVVTFMITGTVSFSGVITIDDEKINGNTWLNNEEILEEVTINEAILENSNIELNLENNRIIKGSNSNGISIVDFSNIGKIGDINNNGLISGESQENNNNTGNGVGVFNFKNYKTGSLNLNNIKNSGIISGHVSNLAKANNGNGIGIYNYNSNPKKEETINLKNIVNTGIIKGESPDEIIISSSTLVNKSNGIGIYNYNSNISKLGTIKIEGEIINKGILSGKDVNITPSKAFASKGNGLGIFNSEYGREIILDNKIENAGIIEGYSTDNISNKSNKGNGIGIYNSDYSGEIILSNKIENIGIIKGYSILKNQSNRRGLGYSSEGNGLGINARKPIILNSDIVNNGILSGQAEVRPEFMLINAGNGLGMYAFDKIKTNKIINNGISTGYITGELDNNSVGGNGLSFYGNKNKYNDNFYFYLDSIINKGVALGNKNGIYINRITSNNSEKVKYANYGVVGGGESAVKIENSNIESKNYGIYLTFDADKGTISIIERAENSEHTMEGKDFFIINGEKLDNNIISIKSSELSSKINNINNKYIDKDNGYKNIILNGVNDTLTIEKGDSPVIFKDSIINAYQNAVLIDGGDFEGQNVIINGGGLRNDKIVKNIVVKGTEENDKFALKGNSILNGDFDGGKGDDIVSFDTKVQINGNLDGGEGADVLTFNPSSAKSTADNINILHNISNFENIDVNSSVTLFETIKVTGTKEITINKDGNLVVRIDSTEKNSEGVYNSNALVNNKGTVESKDGGILSIALNGLGNGDRIDLGNDVSSLEKNKTIKTTSMYHSIKEIENNKHIVEIGVKEDIEEGGTGNQEDLKYSQLNKIHKSIISSGQDGVLSGITNEKENGKYLSYLNDIYTGSPYSYSSELSRSSINLFKESILNKDLNPELKKWAIYGGLTHIDGGMRDTYFGKNYYGWDIGSSEIKSDSKILGAYVQGEYKHTETFNSGFVLGGSNLETKINTGSNLDGNSFYAGAYAKKYIGNIKLTSGLGFQYGSYDSERYSNNYGIATLPAEKYSTDYNDKGFNIYGEIRYLYEVDKNISIEPYLSLNYAYLKQDGITEDSKPLAMKIESEDFKYTTAKIGIESKKKIFGTDKIHTFTVGASYERFLDGADEKYLTAKMRENGSNFDLLVTEKAENVFGFNVKYEFEKENGFIFDLSGNYVFEKQNHTASGEHKFESQWIVGMGAGYKF